MTVKTRRLKPPDASVDREFERVLGPFEPDDLRHTQVAKTTDAVGLFCPLPVIRAGEAVDAVSPGDVVLVLADDPGVVLDMAAWCKSTHNELLGILIDSDSVFHCYLRKSHEERS